MSDESKPGEAAPATSHEKKPGTALVPSSAGALARVCQDMKSMQALALSVYESAWFGAKTPHSAMMIVATMVTERLSPVAFKAKYWVLPSGPSIKAEWMLAEFNRNYGTSQVIACTAERACIELKRNNQKKAMPFEFTWEEAQQEPYVWTKEAAAGTMKKKLPDGTVNPAACKDTWATPAGRRDMLWARVVTAALRKVCPEVISGATVAEENDDYTDAEVVAAPAAKASGIAPVGEPTTPAQTTAPASETTEPTNSSVPPPEPASQTASPALAETPAAVSDAHQANGKPHMPTLAECMAMDSADRRPLLWARMKELLDQLIAMEALTLERFKAVLSKKWGAGSAKSLTDEQLGDLVVQLVIKLKEVTNAKDLDDWGNRVAGLTEATPT